MTLKAPTKFPNINPGIFSFLLPGGLGVCLSIFDREVSVLNWELFDSSENIQDLLSFLKKPRCFNGPKLFKRESMLLFLF